MNDEEKTISINHVVFSKAMEELTRHHLLFRDSLVRKGRDYGHNDTNSTT